MPASASTLERHLVRPRQSPEGMAQDLSAFGIIDRAAIGQFGLGRPPSASAAQRSCHSASWHDRGGQQISLAEDAPEAGKLGIGSQIATFDIDVGDTAAAMLDDLVARPYGMLARAQFDLGGPSELRQELADVDRPGSNGGIGSEIGTICSSPIGLKPIAAGGIGTGWLVLKPHAPPALRGPVRADRRSVLPATRSRRACKTASNSCRAAIGPGNLGTGIAERSRALLDDIVPRRADDMDEELTAEFRKPEASPDFAASRTTTLVVDPKLSAPLCKDFAHRRRTASSNR